MIPDINYTQFMLKVNIPMQQTLISLFVISEANYASSATSGALRVYSFVD